MLLRRGRYCEEGDEERPRYQIELKSAEQEQDQEQDSVTE